MTHLRRVQLLAGIAIKEFPFEYERGRTGHADRVFVRRPVDFEFTARQCHVHGSLHPPLARQGRVQRTVHVTLPGGELEIDWPTDEDPIRMAGPATFVFEGEFLDGDAC